MATLTISRLKTKEITTRNGPTSLHNFQSGGIWYSSFVGSWNEDWENGMELILDDSQIKRVEKDGKVFNNINEPAGEKKKGGRSKDFEDRVINALALIWKDVQAIKKRLEGD